MMTSVTDEDDEELLATLYVVAGCPLCAQARAALARRGVNFIERDVAADFGALRRMYRATRQGLVPVIEYRGRAVLRPDERQLASLLRSGAPD